MTRDTTTDAPTPWWSSDRPRWLLPVVGTLVVVLATAVRPWLVVVAVPVAYVLGRGGRTWAAAAGLVVALASLPLTLDLAWAGLQTWTVVVAVAVPVALLPWLVGRHVRDRARVREAEARLADNLAQRDLAMVERARERERTRIAKEMHDTLGHRLSLIALRAGALEVGTGGSSEATRTGAELRAEATRATEQLNEIIGLLADAREPAPLRPQPDDLGGLVREAVAAGLTVELRAHEEDLGGLPALVHHAVLRVVQEGLTNSAKHAPEADVTVTVDRATSQVRVLVRSDGPPTFRPAVSGGRGLPGLRDRVDYLGGGLRAEPREDGFELEAWLPTTTDGAPGDDGPGTEESPHASVAADQRRSRRSATWLVLAPLATLLFLGILLTSWFTYVTIASVLSPTEYDGIAVGDRQDDVEEVLPPVQMLEPPRDRLPVPADGATCRFYEGEVSFFDRRQVYRVCFADGEVVSTDTIEPETT